LIREVVLHVFRAALARCLRRRQTVLLLFILDSIFVLTRRRLVALRWTGSLTDHTWA